MSKNDRQLQDAVKQGVSSGDDPRGFSINARHYGIAPRSLRVYVREILRDLGIADDWKTGIYGDELRVKPQRPSALANAISINRTIVQFKTQDDLQYIPEALILLQAELVQELRVPRDLSIPVSIPAGLVTMQEPTHLIILPALQL